MTHLTRRHNERGQTLVEFALVVPILVLLMVGILDFGRAIYAYNTISNASRQAVRLAIVNQNVSNVEAEATQHAVGLGVTAADVNVTFRQPGSAAVCVTPIAIACEVEVVVRYQFVAATPIIGNIVGPLDLSSTSREPVERSYESP